MYLACKEVAREGSVFVSYEQTIGLLNAKCNQEDTGDNEVSDYSAVIPGVDSAAGIDCEDSSDTST